MKKLGAITLLLFLGSGCQTINFVTTPEPSRNYKETDFHHIWFLTLIEGSQPVNTKATCGSSQWESIRTRVGPVQAIIGLAAGPVYAPMEVAVSCKKN